MPRDVREPLMSRWQHLGDTGGGGFELATFRHKSHQRLTSCPHTQSPHPFTPGGDTPHDVTQVSGFSSCLNTPEPQVQTELQLLSHSKRTNMATPVSASPFSSALPLLPLLPRRLLPLLLPLLLYLTILPPQRQGAVTAQSADCSDASSFRSGQEDFVVDAEDATEEGAELLATAHAQSRDDCVRACCATPRCDLALLQSPNGDIFAASAENRTCVLFRCVHRNRFVCRFVNQRGYSSYVRESVYRKYLAGPQESRECAVPLTNESMS